MFKTVSTMHLETVNDSDWSSFAVLEKQQDSFKSAFIDKVRISYVVGEEETEVAQGMLFVASMDDALDSTTPSNNDGQIISASASRGGGGVVTLPIKRSIRAQRADSTATLDMQRTMSGSPIYLHCRSAEIGEATKIYVVLEVWGRWHKATSL